MTPTMSGTTTSSMTKIRYSEFKDRLDIDALEMELGFTPTHTHNGNDIGHCLWPENHAHGDSTGKFAIHRDKQVYNCFVCGGGSLLSLVMECKDLDVDQATQWLAAFTNVGARSDIEYRDYLYELLEDTQTRAESMPYFNPRVLDQGRFDGPLDYFYERGISHEVCEKYHLCYSNLAMKPAPYKNGVKIDDDYYGPVAIFPHWWQGKLVGWQHRWMDWNEERSKTPRWLAKYTNTTDFPKHTTLYNHDAALKARTPVVVVESVPTVLFLESLGIPAVSYFGGTPQAAQLRLLRRLSQGVILAPDNDKVGDDLLRMATPVLERFIPVYHADKVTLGPKADLGDYAYSDNSLKSTEHLTHHIHLIKAGTL